MYDDIKDKLKATLSTRRYDHSVRVAEMARELARRFQEDEGKAYLAGLLHDCARELSEPDLVRFVKEHHLQTSEYDQDSPMLLHTVVGAALARDGYNVTDNDVLQAIASHTVGGADMPLLSKIVYVADFIEPGRHDDMTKHVRVAALQDLDRAVFEKAKFMIEYSQKLKEQVHPVVQDTFKHYRAS